jgi:hypothetical protein
MHACELIIAGDPRIGKVPERGELRDRGRRRRLNLFPMTLWLSSGQARVYKPAPKGPAPSSFVQPDDHSSTRLHDTITLKLSRHARPYDQNIPDRWECRFYDEISG